MKEMIKKYVASVVCALATLLITGSVWAAVNPTAVFSNFTGADSETGITVGGYTLKANGNTVDAHGITISTTSGVTLEPTSGNNNVTVIVRYSNLPTATVTQPTILIANKVIKGSSTQCNNTGILLTANNSNKATTYYNDTVRDESKLTLVGTTKQPIPASSGRFVYSYNAGGGTGMYFGANDGTLDGSYDGGVKWGSSPLTSISIGSYRNEGTKPTNAQPATGMKIEEIAVIAGTSYLNAAGMNELAAYKFPSETAKEAVVAEWTDFNDPTSGDFTWTIGNTCTVNADGSVTIGASNGLTLTVPSSCSEMYDNRKLTVILDADTPNFSAEKALIDATVTGSNKLSITYDGSIMRQRWNIGGSWGDATFSLQGRHVIACTYQGEKNVGTTTYVDGVQKIDNTGLQGSSGNITKIGIGNYNTNGGNIATGMRVYRVAIFAKKLSAAEVAAYKFPTSSVLAVNFSDSDAATVISATSGDIDVLGMTIPGSAWFDSNKTATQTNPQTVIAYDLNGKEVLGDTAKVIWTSKNTWKYTDVSSMPLKGYLDDGNHDGKGAEVHFTNIPFSLYDAIIIYSTDKGTCFNAPTVNDESYTYKNGEVCKGSDTWGTPKTGTIVEGVNALRIKDLTGPTLDILATPGDPMGSANRACIAAVVIVERTDVGPTVATATLKNDAEIFWSQIEWDDDVAPGAAIPAEITVNNGASIYMDGEVTAKNITFKGTGTVTIIDNNYGTSPTYNVGKITSELPIIVVSETMLTVDSGNNDLTYNYVGAAAATTVPPITCGGNLTLGGSSEIKWTAAVAANKTLTIADTCKVNYYGNGQSIQGTININKNATLVNKNDNDTLGYGSSAHVNVWGTLDMSNTRWTIGNNNVITLYAGAKSIGEGHATYKAFDFNTANNVLKFALGDAASGTATLTTGLRMRNGTGPTLNIPENMTVEFGSIFSTEYDNRTVTKSGAGALKILDALRMGKNTYTLNVGEGMLDLSAITGGSLATQIPGNVTIGSGVSVRFPAGFTTESTFTLCNGTLSVANQRERHAAVYIGDSDTPVANAIIVYDTTEKTVTYEIESSRDIDLTELNTVTLDDIINKVDDDTWTGDVKVAVKNGATVEIGDDTIPYSGIIVTCDGAVSINYTAETADNFAKYDFTNVAGDLTIETGIELDIDAGERALVYTYTGDEAIAPTLVASAITINTGAQVDVNAGTAPLTYNYNGEEEITPALVGSGAFTKGGTGTICVNFGASRTAETIVNAGVLKTTAQKALGTNYTVTINANGVLDFNGYSNNGQPTIVLNGGTLRNTRADQPTSQMQILNLSLTASSTIDAQEDFGLVGNGHGKTTLNLGEYILTKSGDGQFHIVNTEVSGSGTIKVAAGSLHVSNSACTMENGTIELDGGNLGLDAAFTLNYLTIKNGEITGNGALTLTGAMEIAGNTTATAKLASVASPLEIANGAVYDLTGVTLPIANIIGATQNGSIKIDEPAKAAKIAPVADGVTEVPAGLTIVDADGNAITTVCVYDGFLWYGNVGSGTYTVTNGDIAAMNEMNAGDIYSPNSLEVNIATISGTPTGFFGWVENATAYFAKQSNSISIKLGTRTANRDSRILTTDTNVGGFPVAGKFWNVAKVSNGNAGNPVSDYTTLWDGNKVDSGARIAYYAVNTYFAANSPTPFNTGNERLLGTYLDDGDVAKDTLWTITESSDGTTIPDGGVTLPATPNNRGWEVQISNIPYDMYDLYVYVASDQPEDGLKACPVTISVDNGTTWSYYAGEAKGTDADSWSPLAYSHDGVVTEGRNYIRFRVSKNSTGVEDVSTIQLSHGTRNTGSKKRLGLAAIQIVEIDDDGVRDRKVIEDVETQSWHDEGAWVQTKKDGTTVDHDWVDSTSSNPITARIDASEIPAITMDDDAVVDKLVISGEAETFTIDGEGELTATAIDATEFTGNIVFDAPVTGALSLGENAKLVVEIDDGEEVSVDNLLPAGLTIASGSITIIGSGTLVCDGKVPDAYATSLQNSTWTGTVWIKNILVPDVKNLTQFGHYKNTDSKVCLTGVRGWLNNGSQGVEFELKDETVEEVKVLGLEIQDSSGGYKYVFPKFTGTGSFKAATISTESAAYIVTDVSEFNGALLSTAGTLRKEGHAKDGAATNPRPIFVGYENDSEVTAGTDSLIDIKSGTTVNAGCGWEAASVVFGDTLTVKGEIGDVLVSGVTTAPTALPALVDVTGQPSMTLKYENNAIVLAQAAATFNGKGYATLAEAITAANEATGETATITVYTSIPAEDELEINVAEGKTITLEGVNGACVCNESVVKTGNGTLVINGLINYIEKSLGFAPTISAGTLVLKDGAIASGIFGKSISVHTEGLNIASGAVLEFNVTEEFILMGGFGDSQIAPGTVRKSGTGKMTLMYDAFATFEGTIDLVDGCIANSDSDMTINCALKVSDDACLDATLEDTTKVILGANAILDLSNISEDREDAIVKGNLTMAEGTAIVFAENQEALLCNGALTIGEESITETTTVTGMSIFVDGQEYIADLGIAVAEGESGAKLYTVSYDNAAPIIRITADGMDASDLNAALVAAGEGAKVYFDDEATLTLDENVEDVDLVILGTANIDGEGTISAATIAAAGKTIDLGEDVTFVPATPSELSTTTITGEGTIVYDGVLPGDEKSSYQRTDNWTGTVWLKNCEYQRFDFGALGHSGSKVKLTHIWGYSPDSSDAGANPEIIFADEGSNVALEINNGHGGSKYFFRKLSGDGTFKTSGSQGTNSQYRFYDVSDFEGTFALNGNNKRVVIGTGSTDAGNGQILIDNTATVAIPTGKTWSANNGITVDGTIAGAGILGSNTTFGNGATIDASAAQLTVEANKTLTFGSSLTVKLASAPEEDSPVKIMNGSFTEQTFETTLTVMVNDQQAEGDFAIKQDADGVWAIANTEVVWTGKGTDRNWSNPDNWQGGIVPTAGRNVVIDVGEETDYSIVIDTDTAAIGSLTVTGAGVVFSGEGTINGPITFTTKKIAGSLKAVGDVTFTSAPGLTLDFSAAMEVTGNLMFDRNEPLNFNTGTAITVSGDMTITSAGGNNSTVFKAGTITVAGTLATKGARNMYSRYYFGDGSSSNDTMMIIANKIDANSNGTAIDAYQLKKGATIKVGAGGFDLYGRQDPAATFSFAGGTYVATATSSFSASVYNSTVDSTIEVVDGVTLTINNSGKDFGQAGKKITKTGAGTLKFAGKVLTAIDVTAGAVEMTAGDEAGVTVSEGAKLYLKVTAEQKEAGYTSTAKIPAGMNIYFILPDGTVVEGVGGILPPKTIVWVGDDQGSWDDPSNWSPAVVPLVDSNVGFSGEGEGTITIKISDGTRTVDGVIFDSSKNITIDGVVNVTGAITKDGTGTLAINLGADNSNAIAVTAGTLEVNVPADTTRILSGAITGSGKIVKSGEGALHINRANTGFTGSWDVKGGDLKGLAEKWYGADNNNTPIVLTVNDGATLHLANMGDSAYSLVCNGGTVNNDGTVTGNRYTTGCRQAKNITINGDTTFTGNQFGLLASGYGATTMTFNDNATLTINMNANSAFFMTATTVSGAGTIKVAQGIFSSANNTGAAPVINEGVKVVVDGGTLKADKNTLTIHTLEYVSGSFTSANNAAVKVTGTLSGSPTIPRLTLGNGATIPVTSEIKVSNALALDGSIVIDLGATGSGNFHVIAAPNGYTWDTTKVTLVGSDLTDWNVSAEGTTLVVSKLPLDAEVDEDDGYNFDEKVIKVNVLKIDSTLKGTQIKVVTTDKNGDEVSTTLVQIDGSKGMYDVVIGELTAGETYNFNITFVDSKGYQIDQSKEANLKNIAVGTLIEGEDIFSADATSGESEVDGGEWDTEPTITEGAYVIDDETASVFNVTAADPEGNFTVEYDLSFEPGFATELTAEESAPIAGLTIGAGDTDETTNWYRADSTAETGWSKLDQSVTPGHYIIRMAFTATTVTYSVKGDEDTDFVTLTQNDVSTFDRGGEAAAAIKSVSFQGSSSLAKFGAKTDDTIDIAIANDGENDLTTIDEVLASLAEGKPVTLKTNVAIDTSSLTAGEPYKITAGGFNLRWDDERIVSYDSETGAFTITADKPANGFTSFENYALNLNSGDPSSKPIGVAPADNGKLNTLTVEIKGPDGNELEVRDGYAIKCIATPNVVGGKEVISTNLKQIDLPLPESGEVQYTIKIEVIKE